MNKLLLASLALVLGLAGCAGPANPGPPTQTTAADRHAQLAAVMPMPDPSQYQEVYLGWQDPSRGRDVPAKLYLPVQASTPGPLVVFSHGIGGSREGYSYLGKHWAAQGYASLHLQHVGSDRGLWLGNPLGLVHRLQTAAREEEAMDRARDVQFALDQVLAGEWAPRVDAQRIVAAGHSYGANTVLLLAGAQVQRGGQPVVLRDPRIRAAVLLSAPPFYGESDVSRILGGIRIPTLHITAEADDIRIPGYLSGLKDREQVFAATGSAQKALAVFKDGSHSIFTDRLGTGGLALNPQVKVATRDLTLAFWQSVLTGQTQALQTWPARHAAIVSRFDPRW